MTRKHIISTSSYLFWNLEQPVFTRRYLLHAHTFHYNQRNKDR